MLAISGGVGGAKLALGMSRLLGPHDLTIAVNTGDDETFHGLHVSPDVDTVVYALAGLTNPETGWGVAGDSFRALDALGRLGGETWFRLGDLDLAMHLRRTELLAAGSTLTEATRAICDALGVRHPVVPMSDSRRPNHRADGVWGDGFPGVFRAPCLRAAHNRRAVRGSGERAAIPCLD